MTFTTSNQIGERQFGSCDVACHDVFHGTMQHLNSIDSFARLCIRNVDIIYEALPGVWGFREKGYLFSWIWEEGSFIFGDLGRKHIFWEV